MTGPGRAGSPGRLARALAFGCYMAVSGGAHALDKIPDLNGTWSGAGLRLVIDTARHQGNFDPTRPFDRQPFIIRNVTGKLVVFVIGDQVFVAQMDGVNRMTVSRGGLFETYTLTRETSPVKGR